jgi:uncharacterized protein (TIGR03084 family)
MFEQPADFRAESEALHALLEPLADADYARATRFKGWTIDEVLRHLHVWNNAALLALEDEPAFVALVGGWTPQRGKIPIRDFERAWCAGLGGRALREAWIARVRHVAERFALADPRRRVKWSGPDMSVRSSITARLMETWAHGQAVYDLLGVERRDADRIRNIATLGINTYGWTFSVRGTPPPAEPPQVRLTAPSGAIWTWHEGSDSGLIEGSASEFCQVVTQVRNIADTRLAVHGEAARRWMACAQCFAGGPEPPPAPGTRFREPTPA